MPREELRIVGCEITWIVESDGLSLEFLYQSYRSMLNRVLNDFEVWYYHRDGMAHWQFRVMPYNKVSILGWLISHKLELVVERLSGLMMSLGLSRWYYKGDETGRPGFFRKLRLSFPTGMFQWRCMIITLKKRRPSIKLHIIWRNSQDGWLASPVDARLSGSSYQIS